MTLLELQRRTLAAVTQPLTAGERMRTRSVEGRSMRAESECLIKPNDRLSSFERLEIYNRQYWFRLLSAMTEDFPGLAQLVGERAFERLSIAYLRANPSRSFTLRNLGDRLEGWLSTYTGKLPCDRALLLDVVRLEWAHIEAFDNAEQPRLSLSGMEVLSESSLLGLQPHLRLVALSYPVDNFVVAAHHAQDEPEVASNALTGSKRLKRRRSPRQLQPERIYLAVHRFDESVYYKRLERDSYTVLQRLREGYPLGDALERGAAESLLEADAFVDEVRTWFANWSELGWFIRPAASSLQT